MRWQRSILLYTPAGHTSPLNVTHTDTKLLQGHGDHAHSGGITWSFSRTHDKRCTLLTGWGV